MSLVEKIYQEGRHVWHVFETPKNKASDACLIALYDGRTVARVWWQDSEPLNTIVIYSLELLCLRRQMARELVAMVVDVGRQRGRQVEGFAPDDDPLLQHCLRAVGMKAFKATQLKSGRLGIFFRM